MLRAIKKPWFVTKKYGWGWAPATWQGWAVLALFVVLTVAYATWVDGAARSEPESTWLFLPVAFVLTVVLIVVCYLTGEKPRWRWGK